MPDRRAGLRTASRPAALIGTLVSTIGISLVAVLYLLGAPLVALATGTVQLVLDIRDSIVRPRPFTGARHGLPFLDAPAPTSVAAESIGED